MSSPQCPAGHRRLISSLFVLPCSTTRYMAPEVLLLQKNGIEADIYSFGVVLWEVLTLQTPYEEVSGSEDRFIKEVLYMSYRPTTSSIPLMGCRKLIKACWDHDFECRPKMSRVVRSIIREINTALSKRKQDDLSDTVHSTGTVCTIETEASTGTDGTTETAKEVVRSNVSVVSLRGRSSTGKDTPPMWKRLMSSFHRESNDHEPAGKTTNANVSGSLRRSLRMVKKDTTTTPPIGRKQLSPTRTPTSSFHRESLNIPPRTTSSSTPPNKNNKVISSGSGRKLPPSLMRLPSYSKNGS